MLNWIASLPERRSYFYGETYSYNLLKTERLSLVAINFVNIFIPIMVGLILIMELLVQVMMEGNYHPLPLKSHLPFLPPINPIFYLINLVQQTYTFIQALLYARAVVGFILTVLVHAYCDLGAIDVLVGHMSDGIKTGSFQDWLRLTASEFQDCKTHMDLFLSKMLPILAYYSEKLIYSCLIQLWLTYKVERDLLPWAIGSLSVVILGTICVIINEMIQYKVSIIIF